MYEIKKNSFAVTCDAEVTDILGLPQRRVTSGAIVVEYELSNGGSAYVRYLENINGYLVVENIEILRN